MPSRARAELRYEPTEKRVRAMISDHTVADSTAAALVWEPRRVVPCYAVPVEDLDAKLRVDHLMPPSPPKQSVPTRWTHCGGNTGGSRATLSVLPLERTSVPGVYQRGVRFVVMYRSGGRQHARNPTARWRRRER